MSLIIAARELGFVLMLGTSEILELRRRSRVGIFGVTYRRGRPRETLRLPDGAIVESLTPKQRRDAPEHPIECMAIASDGRPATVHDANLGLIATFLTLDGVFLLPSGDVVAVYGADAEPIA
jgi:hypothetical protein